ncbi:MAG: SLC13 family permease [Candidatus Coproplasma sp.]
MFALIVSCITGIAVFLAVLIKPYFNVGKVKIGTYWLISLLGAVVLLISGSVPLNYLWQNLTAQTSVNPLKILVLFFGMTAISVFLDEAGFFRCLANAVLKRTGNSQFKLFVTLYIVVSVLTVFTSNDIVVLTFTPFICLFCKKANVNPIPYLFAEFVGANTWSMLLIIGNPTNIYLATFAGIDFASYLSKMALPTCFAGITSFIILFLIFRKSLKKPMTAVTTSEERIEDKPSLIVGLICLVICTVLLVISSYISLEMYLIAGGTAIALFITVLILKLCRKKRLNPLGATLKRLPYELIPFLVSMFVIVLSLDYCSVTEKIGKLLFAWEPTFTVGISSFFIANIINNIPMSVLYGAVIGASGEGTAYLQGIYSAIIGSNIGAYFTPVGALAGIMWVSILKRFEVDFSFKKYIAYGSLVGFPALLSALLGLLIAI